MQIFLRHFGWPQQALFNGSFVSMEMTSERRSSGRLANLSGRSASLRSVSEFLGNSKKSSYFFFAIVRSACAGGVEGGWCVEFFGVCGEIKVCCCWPLMRKRVVVTRFHVSSEGPKK